MKPAVAAIISALAATSPAWAEAVRVQALGRDVGEGQGWLFRDAATGFCGVVTAAHVAAPSGRPARIVLTSRDKGQGVGVDVRVLSPERDDANPAGMDIALMRVEGGIVEHGCTTANLGSSDLDYELARSQSGVISRVSEGGEQVWQDAQFIANSDDDRHRLALRATHRDEEITEGFSGSPVTETAADRLGPSAHPQPLAMITEVDVRRQTARAIRFDAIKPLVQQALRNSGAASAASRPGSGPVRVVDWMGDTTDLGCPATAAADPRGACGWRVRPPAGQRGVRLVLDPGRSQVSHIEVTLAPAGAATAIAVEVAAAANSEDWAFAKTVRIAGPTAIIDFPAMRAARVRLSISSQPGNELEIKVGELR